MRRLVSPLRRVLAIDAGSRSLALLLMESEFGRLRIVQQEAIDLRQEGLVAADETKAHLRARLEEWGSPPVALVLPQHLSTSQAFDLPPGPETEVQKLIEQETVKLSGVSESKIIYDFVRTETGASNRHQFWITLAREEDVRDRIAGLGLRAGELCDVTTTANALIFSILAGALLGGLELRDGRDGDPLLRFGAPVSRRLRATA